MREAITFLAALILVMSLPPLSAGAAMSELHESSSSIIAGSIPSTKLAEPLDPEVAKRLRTRAQLDAAIRALLKKLEVTPEELEERKRKVAEMERIIESIRNGTRNRAPDK